ncbi:hypothetical protein LJ707_15885 [Mucilaginibacter sp. UR6-1]|uniref:hypothetical protein n=1 Tax=Mucilaginibacter sp. UR6-1 TaxID=1435643 RepID=UPI001E2A1FED|nr:hypothetical protein [Mucilaginibacter sp. UR6-1]MCC8410423.1 hypothetical protein [Mucilaginibacter sp. UR6-1]
MKSINNKPATSKLAAKFDTQLRDMLMQDLQAFRAKHPKLSNNQEAAQRNLSAA